MPTTVDILIKATDQASGALKLTAQQLQQVADDATRGGASLGQLNGNIDRMIADLRAATPANAALGIASDKVWKSFEAGKMTATEAADALEQMKAEMDAASQGAGGLEAAWEKVNASSLDATEGTDAVTESTGKGADSMDGLKSGIGEVVQKLTGFSLGMVSGAGAVLTLVNGMKNAIDSTVELGTETRNLTYLIGASAEESGRLISVADDVGVSYETLTRGLEAAIRKGYDPTIAGLARIGEEYRALQDPIEKSKYLMDTFGRAGADLAPLLEKTGSELNKMADGNQKLGVVMGRDGVDAVKKYKIAINELNDVAEAQKIKVGNVLIPVWTDFLNLLTAAYEEIEKHAAANKNHYTPTLSEMGDKLAELGGSYRGVTLAIGLQETALDALKTSYSELGTIISGSFGNEMKGFAKSQGDIQAQIDDTAGKLSKLGVPEFMTPASAAKVDALQKKLGGVSQQLADIAKANKVKLSDLINTKDIDKMDLSGPVVEQIKALKGESYQLYSQIKDLGGLPYATEDQKKQIDDLRAKYGLLGQQLDDTAKAHELAMKKMAYDMLMQRASSDGLTQNEVTNLTEIAKQWGLYDETTANVINNINSNIGQLDTQNPKDLINSLQGVLNLQDQITFGGGKAGTAGMSGAKQNSDATIASQARIREAYRFTQDTIADPVPFEKNATQVKNLADMYDTTFRQSVLDASGLLSQIQGQLDGMNSKTITVRVVYDDPRAPVTHGSEKNGGERYASGGSFVVPSGFPDDSYYLGSGHWAQSGEKVTISPSGGGSSGGGMVNNFNGDIILPAVTNARQFVAELGRLTRNAANAGAGYAGG